MRLIDGSVDEECLERAPLYYVIVIQTSFIGPCISTCHWA